MWNRCALLLLVACSTNADAPSADAGIADAAMPDAAEPDAPAPMLVKHPTPVLGGASEVASDPSVRRIGAELVMVYTCLPDGVHTAICEARSTDGLSWTKVPSRVAGMPAGTIRIATPPETSLEVPELIVSGGEPIVFASTYGASAVPVPGYPAKLVRISGMMQTVLTPSTTGPDCDAIYSPAIRTRSGMLEMIYSGHCYDDPQPAESTAGLAILRATSGDGGRTWTRHGRAVAPESALAWTANGLAEPSWIDGDDRGVLLVSGGFGEGEGQRFGLARPDLQGVLRLEPDTLLTPTPGTHDRCGAFSPTAILENGRLRIWYLAFDCTNFSIGYAEAPAAILGDVPAP